MSTFPGFPVPAAGMDQPLEVLAACHERIERQCATLERLAEHLASTGADAAARTAASGVIRYFTRAAIDHHADEETDLFPALLESVAGSDVVCLRTLLDSLAAEHVTLAAHWRRLHPLLENIGANAAAPQRSGREKSAIPAAADGTMPDIDALTAAIAAFVAAYRAHIARENAELLPTAARLLDDDALFRLSRAMTARRHVTPS